MEEGPQGPPVEAGQLQAGASEAYLELPAGTPLSGYTARCGCLGGVSRPDTRDSAYTTMFVESSGVHIMPGIKVIWLDNGNERMVWVKHDLIYSWEGIVEALTERLEAETGEELSGNVIHSANHNHSGFGDFSGDVAFFLGHDKYNEEIFQTLIDQTVAVALDARAKLQPAKMGVGWAKDWDPDGRVYRDRRGENDQLQIWPDQVPGFGKDPYLTVFRIDDLQDQPIAVAFGFGMHPYVTSESSSLVSADATNLIERTIAEEFDHPVVAMHFQTAGGDTSVAGTDDGPARMETVGEYARDAILDVWGRTPTTADPITFEVHSQHVSMRPEDIHVTRGGTVDWRYAPYNPSEDFEPDDKIFDANGKLISPIDEFNTPSNAGAVFCGTGDLDLPIGGLASGEPPYDKCLSVDILSRLIKGFFSLTEEQVALPLASTVRAGTAAARFQGLPTLFPDGTTGTNDLLIGFFPGEPGHSYAEAWRRDAAREGYEQALLVGYSMDHEGYLLPVEDWMIGEYEADVFLWGPLGGEHLLERTLEYAVSVLESPVHEARPAGKGPTPWTPYPMPTEAPDTSPNPVRVTALPEEFWWPDDSELGSGHPGFTPMLEVPDEVQRVRGQVQLAWEGGDPGVDRPMVVLERQEGDAWVPVTTPGGHLVNSHGHDMIVTYTPQPLFPSEAPQQHYWWVVWQAVGHVRDRAGLPVGTYRLVVRGDRYVSGATYPWSTEAYEVIGDAFELVPAPLRVELSEDAAELWVSLDAPVDGFRMIDVEGASRGPNPLRGDVTVRWLDADGAEISALTMPAGPPVGGRTRLPASVTDRIGPPEGTARIEVVDAWGNRGGVDVGGVGGR